MAVPRWLRASCVGSVAVALLFLVPASLGAPAPPGGRSAPVGQPCLGASLDPSYSGVLRFEGGPLPASDLANVSLEYSYEYQTTVLNRTGAPVSVSCSTSTHTVRTGPGGAFQAALSLPADECDRETGECEVVSGPFAPLSLGPALSPPAGYRSSTTVQGSSISVWFVADLASLALDPQGPVAAYSPSATEMVVAQPLAGNGSGTPGVPQFTWTLAGSGWRFLGAPNGSAVNLTAAPGSGLGTLSVQARLTVGNTTFLAGPATLSLEAVATTILTTNENRSEVDAGESVAISLTASGAPGYPYTAVALPGLGLSAQPLTCSSQSDGTTSELLSCATDLTYPDPGVGTPEVVVSNGYSSGSEDLAPVTVNPPPALAVAPASPLGYAGQPVSLRVTALPGTGTPPYRGACLEPGSGAPLCETGPGPSWSFQPTYATPGTYSGSAWTVDSSGTNSSVGLTVVVAAPLALSPVVGASAPVVGGEPANFSVNLSGGFLPGRFWWNLSGTAGSVAAGTVGSDGPLVVAWVPSTVGSVLLSVTVVDALGSAVERSVVVSVGAAPALSVGAVELPPGGPVMAGTPVGVAWEAFDQAGAPAVAFSAPSEVSLTGPHGSAPALAWVNASGVGPLLAVAAGVFAVPPAAWDLGRLNLSVATSGADAWTLRLANLDGLRSPPPLTVYVSADLAHLRLVDPEVVLPGDRANHTLWHIEDEFGNPAPEASVEVEFSGASFSEETVAPVLSDADGTAGVWVNYSAPTSAGGSLEVRSPLSGVLLGPILVPAAPAGSTGDASFVLLGLGLPTAAAALTGGALAVRRRRHASARAELSEEDLRRFVEGRDRVIAAVGAAGVADLARIEAAWAGTPPPAELPDWVASLVADGTLGARGGPDGVARFCLAGSALGPARILLDEAALAEATRVRDGLVGGPEVGRRRPDEPP